MDEATGVRAGQQAGSVADEAATYDRVARTLSDASQIRPVAVLGYGDDPAQKIELYRPRTSNPGELLPILVFLHGGAWIAGGFHWLRFMAEAVVSQPAIFAALSYRLAPDHKWPAQLEDGIEALQVVQKRISQFGGDPDRLVVAGHSAGGQIAAMSVLSRRVAAVRACMPVSSPMDLRYGRVPSETGKGRVYRYLLAAPEDDVEASPICALEGHSTPFHLSWGERDFDHIRDSCARMCQALHANGQPVTQRIEPDAGHFDTHLQLSNQNAEWYRVFRSFVDLSPEHRS